MCASLNNGDIGFCKCKPCSENEGPCTSPGDCLGDVRCGSNNCPTYLDFEQGLDCCYKSNIGDELFCNSEYTCGQDEGDCDFNNECQNNLFCDPTNSCPAYLGFASDVNCCSSGSGCMSYKMILKQKKFTTTYITIFIGAKML